MMPFQRPVRVMYCPLPVAPIMLPTISGSISRPAWVGVWSRATWKYWLRNTEAPNCATPTARLPRIESVVIRVATMRGGTSGSGWRRSTTIAATRATSAAPRNSAVSTDHQSKLLPAKETQTSGRLAATVMNSAPQ